MQEFKGKTAVVTGAASGIGFSLAERFAKAGMQVVLADIEEQSLDQAVSKLQQQNAKVLGVVTNAMDESSVKSLADQAISEFGQVHVLCNNAGVTNAASAGLPLWELPKKDWDWVMGVNFYGVLYGVQAFVPHMLDHGEEGHIINTASGAALLPGQGIYGISKHGILCLTESLYLDLKARDSAISASVLCPGIVNTKIVDAERTRPADLVDEKANPISEEIIEMGKTMLAQGKDPMDVADEVFESIQHDCLYILPNRAWDALFVERINKVIGRGGPLILDQLDILDRNAKGEDF